MGSSAVVQRDAGKKDRTPRTAILTFTFVLAGAAMAFGTTLYLGNTVGDVGTGIFFQIMAFFSITTVACTFGADTGLVRTLSAQKALGNFQYLNRVMLFAVGPVLAAGIIMATVLWFAADWIENISGIAGLSAAVKLSAPLLVPASIMALFFGSIRGLGYVASFSALQNMVLPISRFILVAIAVVGGSSLLGLTAAWTLPVLLVVVIAGMLTKWALRQTRCKTGSEGLSQQPAPTLRSFWGFSSARGFSSLVETLLEWIDVIAVGVFLGPAAAGIYGAVNRCVRLGTMLEHTARLVTGPLMSGLLAVNDNSGAQRLFSGASKALVLFAWPFYLTLAIFGPVVLSLFGDEFKSGSVPLAVISMVMMFAVSAGGVQSMLLMGGKSKWQLINKLSALTAAVALNLWLVPLWGLLGAVTAWSVAVVVDYGLATLEVALSMGFWVPIRELIPLVSLCLIIFGAGGLMWSTALGMNFTALALNLIVGFIAYGFICLKFPRRFGLEPLMARVLRSSRPTTND